MAEQPGWSLPPRLLSQSPRFVWRVHSSNYRATLFNPGTVGSARFSPLVSSAAAPVPTLYLASTIEAALMESVFREVPTPPGEYILDLARLADAKLVVSRLRIARRLRLVDLTSKGLKRLGLTRSQMIDTTVLEYSRTRAFSENLHHTTEAQGLSWTSKQDDEARAFLLFGDRVPASALEVVDDGLPLTEEPQLQRVIQLALRIGITRIYQG